MAKQQKLEKVLEPLQVGSLTLRNRMIHMGSHGCIPREGEDEQHPMSPRWLDFYRDLAKGFALVSVAGGIIKLNREGTEGTSTIRKNFSPAGLKELAGVIKAEGSIPCWQLLLGYPTRVLDQSDYPSRTASALNREQLEGLIPYYNECLELTKEQIKLIVDEFAETSFVLKEAGFQAIEINAGHDHGLNTFVSPAWNFRTDEYGGSPENRARIVCEINEAIKARCGEDFVIINNIAGAELQVENGRRVEDTVELCKCFEAHKSDAIHCRYEVYHEAIPELGIPRTAHESPDVDLYPSLIDKDLSDWGINSEFGKGIFGWSGAAAAIKKAVNIPVSVSGRTDAFNGEKLIAEGKLDMFSICRRTQADREYAKKIVDGDYDDIRPCVGCNTCYDMSAHSANIWCMVNGKGTEGASYDIFPAETKKKVLVIGSGASGLECARVAALRGHEVIIAEKEPALGGTLPLAGMMSDFHYDFLGFSQWQVRQVEKLGVDIRLKTTVDKEFVEKVKPDVIFVCVGGAENLPDIPGIDSKIVVTGEELHKMLKTATKFFNVESIGKLSKLAMPLGKKIALIGGGVHGLQTAHFLMKRGREVVIIEPSNEFGAGMIDCGPKPNMIRFLVQNNVEMHRNVTCKEITKKGVAIVEADGTEKFIECDNVVTTLPLLNNMSLYDELQGLAPEIYAVGDCNPLKMDIPYPPSKVEPVDSELVWPAFTTAAIREAYRIAREV